jgi:hypothetical protein
MDAALLVDVCVAIATAFCVALLIYGVWLCLPGSGGSRSKDSRHEGERESEAVVREPRHRVRAGTRGG